MIDQHPDVVKRLMVLSPKWTPTSAQRKRSRGSPAGSCRDAEAAATKIIRTMRILLYGILFTAGALAVALTGSLWAVRRPAASPAPSRRKRRRARGLLRRTDARSGDGLRIRRRPRGTNHGARRRVPGPAPEGMVWIPAGRFSMGSDYAPFTDARPIHPVELDGFWMDRIPVTNEQFERFVRGRATSPSQSERLRPRTSPAFRRIGSSPAP